MPSRGQRGHLVRVGRQQPDPSDTQLGQDVRGGLVVACIGRDSRAPDWRRRCPAPVLEGVRTQLGQQPDSAALVAAQIDHDPAAGVADLAERGLQLLAAVAAPRAERVPGQALRVNPHQRWRTAARADVAEHQGDVLGAVGPAKPSIRKRPCSVARVVSTTHSVPRGWICVTLTCRYTWDRGRQFTDRYSSLGRRGQAVGHRGHAVVRVVSGIAIADLSAREQLLLYSPDRGAPP